MEYCKKDYWSDRIIEIRKFLNTKNKKQLIQEIRKNFQQIDFKGISLIYEAMNNDPDKWGDFFAEEFKRAYEGGNVDNLQCLEEINYPINLLKEYDLKIYSHLVKILRTSNNKEIDYITLLYLDKWTNGQN